MSVSGHIYPQVDHHDWKDLCRAAPQMADRVVNLGYTQPGWEKPFPVHKHETDVSQTK